MLHVFEHALIDSFKVFLFVFCLYFILGFLEKIINNRLSSNSKSSPFLGALLGLVPQCGISVAASDLYIKRKITIGTLIAVFLACSDEAVFILLSSDKAISVIPLLIIKLIEGFLFGSLIDLVFKTKLDNDDFNEDVHCCHHEHVSSNNKIINNLVHTLSHSLEIFMYVLIVNLIFETIIYNVGEDNLINFFQNNTKLSPLIAVLIGLIPNCSSSIVLTELYIIDGLSFGALLAGLSMNAGLGLVYLFKDKKNIMNTILIVLLLFIVSLSIGYLTCIVTTF